MLDLLIDSTLDLKGFLEVFLEGDDWALLAT